MNLEAIRENKGRVILQFAIPSIIAMVLTSMITIVDGFFIGNYVGEEGLAAVNLGLPIVYLYLAIGLLVSVGGSSIAGRLFGAGNIEGTNAVFRQTMTTTSLVSLLLTLVMLLVVPVAGRFYQTDSQTLLYFEQYYGILIFELPLMIIVSSFGMFIRGEGNPVFVMKTNIVTVLLNVVLDYVFVKLLLLGVSGVALASLLSVVVVFLWNLLYFLRSSKVFKLGRYRFSGEVLKETILNGSSEFIGEMAMCLSMVAYNYVILKHMGVEGVAAFTIVGYVSYLFSMVIIGFGQGIVPIVSFTYGAGERKLAIQVRKTTNRMVVTCAVVFFAVLFLGAGFYCGIFAKKESIVNMVKPGLRIQMSSFAFAAINTITSFYFTAIGKAKESAIISSARGLVILMICIFTLPALLGMTGVWLVSLTTETITVCMSLYFIQQEKKAYIG